MAANFNLDSAIEQEATAKARQQKAKRLAEALRINLRIVDGTHLVYVFGTGAERDNRAALIAWVNERLGECEDMKIEQEQYNSLKETLVSTLTGVTP